MKYKAVAFDLDGTLVCEKSSWWTIHKYFGTYQQSLINMKDYELGNITYDKFMELDIDLWKPRPHIDIIKKVLLNYSLSPNVKPLIKKLEEKECQTFIVTTAPDILANAVANELGIQNVASNGFIFDEKGYITKNATFKVDLMKKEYAFNKLISNRGLDCTNCIAVGDSKYDIGFLTEAGLGIAYRPDNTLKKKAKIVIDDLTELLEYI
jgi:HAD superfamily PSPase-like hydrolase